MNESSDSPQVTSPVAISRIHWDWKGIWFYLDIEERSAAHFHSLPFVDPNKANLSLLVNMTKPKVFFSYWGKLWYCVLWLFGFDLPSQVLVEGTLDIPTGEFHIHAPFLKDDSYFGLKAVGYEMSSHFRSSPRKDE